MRQSAKKAPGRVARISQSLELAKEKGLLAGPRTATVRGRMPAALVRKAKANSGARTDTQLLEMALAHLAVEDDFIQWMLSRQGTISRDLDLDF